MYRWHFFAKFAPESDCALSFLARTLVEHVTGVEWRAIQMQTDSRVRVTEVFNSMQSQRIC